jgi:hypothetical protein
MEIYLLNTERQPLTFRTKRNNAHAEDSRVELASSFDASNCQNQMVDSLDLHLPTWRMRASPNELANRRAAPMWANGEPRVGPTG